MSQNQAGDYAIDPFTTSGQQLAAILNRLHDAGLTTHSGAARPPYAKAGTVWLDTSTAPGVLKWFDGTNDHEITTGGGLPAGGTTGQVLAKQSNTDGDADWEDILLSGLFHHGTADPADTMGEDGDLYYKVDLTAQNKEVQASFIKEGGTWVQLVAETPKIEKRVMFTPKAGVVTAPHADFVTTLILGKNDAPEFFTKASSKPETIFLEDEDGNNLPFEIEGIDANKAVFHAKVQDLQKAIEIKSDGVTVNTNAGVTGTPAAQAVWGPEYLLVTHMNQSGTDPARDSTSHANHGTFVGSGNAQQSNVFETFAVHLDGAQAVGYQFDNMPEYEVAGEFTILCVCSLNSLGGLAKAMGVFCPHNANGYDQNSWWFVTSQYTTPPWSLEGAILADSSNSPVLPFAGGAIVIGQPSIFAMTRDASNIAKAHNGAAHSTGLSRPGTLNRTVSGQRSNIYLGYNRDANANSRFFVGPYSEFRYLNKCLTDRELDLTYLALSKTLYDITVS